MLVWEIHHLFLPLVCYCKHNPCLEKLHNTRNNINFYYHSKTCTNCSFLLKKTLPHSPKHMCLCTLFACHIFIVPVELHKIRLPQHCIAKITYKKIYQCGKSMLHQTRAFVSLMHLSNYSIVIIVFSVT